MRLFPSSWGVRVSSALALAFTLLPPSAWAVTVTLSPTKDNTLYESATGAVSNGAGEYVFAGKTDRSLIRRAVIHFDIAGALPAGSTINSVTPPAQRLPHAAEHAAHHLGPSRSRRLG